MSARSEVLAQSINVIGGESWAETRGRLFVALMKMPGFEREQFVEAIERRAVEFANTPENLANRDREVLPMTFTIGHEPDGPIEPEPRPLLKLVR